VGHLWKYAALDHDCQRSFDLAGVSLCAPTEEGHCCCCQIGEIFWLNWLSRNLSHRYVYLSLHVKPICLFYFCFTDCIIYIFVLLFNSDNGKEFIATVVVDLLKENNPNCYVVPRICGECQEGCATGLKEHLVRELFAVQRG
jgi:hypothetical protein